MVRPINILIKPFKWLEEAHSKLPDGVHLYPTLKGKKRFLTLKAFNFFIFIYVLLHKLIMPLIMWAMRESHSFEGLELGLWYLYHAQFIYLFSDKNRSPQSFFTCVAIAWFGMGYLPLALGYEIWTSVIEGMSWTKISSLLCYSSSFVWTTFLVYRLRMPTTTYLYNVQGRVRPKVRLALPFFIIGFITSLIWLTALHM